MTEKEPHYLDVLSLPVPTNRPSVFLLLYNGLILRRRQVSPGELAVAETLRVLQTKKQSTPNNYLSLKEDYP